MVDI
jgi:hypothetical protein